MTNATQTLALIFAGTLLLALATSWSWSSSSSAAFQQTLVDVDTSAVQSIQIERGGAPSVHLTRESDGWVVAPSDTSATYPADASLVHQLFSTLPALEVSAVATRQPDKHARYGVDSTGTLVTMRGPEHEPLAQLRIGRTQLRRPQSQGNARSRMQRLRRRQGTPITYVRQPERPDVYSVERSLRTLATRTVENWRDKKLWAVSRSQIRQVDLTFPGDSSFTMTRAAPGDTASGASAATDPWLSAGDTLSTSKVSSALRILSSPEADGFAENISRDAFGAATHTLKLRLADGSTRSLRLRPGASANRYIAVADGYPYVVELDKRRWNRSVLQGRTAMLKKNP